MTYRARDLLLWLSTEGVPFSLVHPVMNKNDLSKSANALNPLPFDNYRKHKIAPPARERVRDRSFAFACFWMFPRVFKWSGRWNWACEFAHDDSHYSLKNTPILLE